MSSRTAGALRLAILAAIATLGVAGPLQAQSSDAAARMQFGIGSPATVGELPPGQLKSRLQSLPPRAQARALRWLQGISFTGTDLDSLRIDDGGGVFFADRVLPPRGAVADVATAVPSAYSAENAFKLHSRPGSANKVYIDFDGHSFTGTAWGAGTFNAIAFSKDADRANFSATERSAIIDIWHRVAEDLAPFDIDVTTEEPAVFNSRTGRIVVTEDQQANGVAMPSAGGGGVAYVNVFGLSNYHSYYSPALVYADNLGPNVQTYIAEASSHEFGHNLGLSHDGTTSGTAYYGGQGSGLVSWAPIMGNSYSRNITQWSKGEYALANQTQDDLAIIGTKLGLRSDDHGNAAGAGTTLVVKADGVVESSNPELDPFNLITQNKGVINSAADVDVFTFTAGAGPLSLTVNPAWEAFNSGTARRGANLDVGLELRNSANAVVASSDPTTDTTATLSATVAAGTYHLVVSGVANTASAYSDYNSAGQYFINGSVTPGSTGGGDTTAPNPNPMTWASVPAATGTSTIAMTASTAVDAVSAVQYRFNCVAGGCASSAWQASPSYTATGLSAGTSYSFSVQARDAAGNETAASATASATTTASVPTTVDVVAAGGTPVLGTVTGTFDSTHSDNGATQSIREAESGGKPASRTSQLEYRWNFTVGSNLGVTVFANAWSSGSTDGDTFNVQYSLNGGGSWVTAFNVSSTSAANMQSFALPGTPSGSILLRVVDSNRSSGARQLNTVSVDHLYLRVAN